MTERQTLVRAFLQPTRWRDADLQPLAGDASTRRYFRLACTEDEPAILMDSPDQPVGRWLEVCSWLSSRSVRVPVIHAADETQGLVLIEDLGDRHLDDAAADGLLEEELYRAAIDLLVRRWQSAVPPSFLPVMDAAALASQLELFLEHEASGTDTEARQEFRDAWRPALELACDGTRVFVHRDLHSRNILLPPTPSARGSLAVIDFQDAFRGPPAYDLVSLLQDARRDLAPGLAERLLKEHLASLDAADREPFALAYHVLDVQRSMRILGIFERLATTMQKPYYRAFKPRVRRHLLAALAEPRLRPVRHWCERHYPAAFDAA